MITIIDKIKLKDPQQAAEFVQWVKEVDYLACQKLPSIIAFQVHQVSSDSNCDFIEVIQVSSWQEFERDMNSAVFSSLVARFSQMAHVSEQIVCDPIAPGYQKKM